MKTRNITVLSIAMVLGMAPTVVPTTVSAAALRAPVMLAQAAPAPPPKVQAAAPKVSRVDAVEARIKDLHTRLRITAAQEDLWSNTTQVMRDNAKTMDEFRKVRTEGAQSRTAVEDFKSYGEMAEVHADGIKKFVPVFSALYDSMSDAQKKNADLVFRRGSGQKAAR